MASSVPLQTLVVNIGGNASGFQGMVNVVQVQTNKLANNVAQQADRMAQSFAKIGTALSVGISLPLMAAGKAAIRAGADFDLGFANVQKTVNATEYEFAELRKGFKNLASDIPVVVEELLEIGHAAGQLGIATDQIMSFTESIARLAVSSNLAADEGAIVLARFANITRMSQKLFPNLASSIVALGNTAATSEQEIASMAMRIGGAGNTVGLTIPHILALSASMSELGIKVERGGTAMSQTLLRMAKAVALGDEKLDGFARTANMTSEAFSEMFKKDAMGALMAMLRGMSEMSTSGIVLALEDMGAEGIRIMDVLQLMSHAIDDVETHIKTAEEGFKSANAHIIESDLKFKSFWFQVIAAKNELKKLGTEIFERTEPALRTLMLAGKETVVWMQSLPPAVQTTAAAMGSLLAVIGPTFLLIAGGVKLWGAMALGAKALATGIMAVKVAVVAISAPFVLMSVAVAAVTAGVVILATVIATKLLKMLGDWALGTSDVNAQLERSRELTSEMNEISDKRHSKVMKEANSIDDLAQRQKFLKQQLEMANKEWKGSQSGIAAATKEVEKHDTVLKGLTGNKMLKMAKQDLEEAIARSGEYGKKSSELKSALEEVNKQLHAQRRALHETMDLEAIEKAAELKRKVDDLNTSLQFQLDTFGMSANKARIYQMELDGASEKELRLARNLNFQLERLKARNEELERQKELQKTFDDFTESLEEQVATFGMSHRQAALYRMELQGLSGIQLQLAEDAIKNLEVMEKQQEMMAKGKQLTEQFMKPADKLKKQQKELSQLFKAGAINIHTYKAALAELQKGTKKDFKVDLGVTGVEGVAAGSAEAMARMADFQAVVNQKGDSPVKKTQPMTPHVQAQQTLKQMLVAKLNNPASRNAMTPLERADILERIAQYNKKMAEREPVVLNPVNFRGQN